MSRIRMKVFIRNESDATLTFSSRPIHKFVSQAVQRFQRISLRLFQSERIFWERRNQGLSIVPISNCLKVVETGLKIISLF